MALKWKQDRWKRSFFTIWTGQALSLVGSRIGMFALIWWLTIETGSATVLAMATLFGMLPQIVLGPFAGVLVDRWNRRVTMIVADTGIALASLGLAYLFWSGDIQVWHVYAIMLLRALGGIFHWPAMQASTSLMVPKEHLGRVSGLNQAMMGALNILGPAFGAALLELTDISTIMLMDVATAAFAVTPLFFILIPQPKRKVAPVDPDSDDAAQPAGSSMWHELREGLRYVFGWRGLMLLTGMAMLFKIVLTPAFSLLPLLVTEHFGGDAPQLALLEAMVGVGVVTGGVLLGVWGGFKRQMLTSLLGISLLGVLMLILGLLPAGWFAAAIAVMLVMGGSLALTDGPLFAVMQSTVAPEMQGRVFMLFGSLVTLTSPIGLLIAGPVTDVIGIQPIYIAAGALLLIAAVWSLFTPEVLNLEHHGQDNVAADTDPDAAEEPAPGLPDMSGALGAD